MRQLIFVLVAVISIAGTSCNNTDKTNRTFTDADIKELKANVEKDALWKEYVNIMHGMTDIVTNRNLYVKEELYRNPPSIEAKLADAKTTEEARQVLLNAGLTEANADLNIRLALCMKNLQQKFPEITQLPAEKLNLQVPLPSSIQKK